VLEEMQSVDLQDQRLNKRLQEVLSQLAGRPTASIPAACGGHAEMTAAYRLFDNPKATFDNIVEAHGKATRQRMTAQPVVLLVQDTSEVDVTRPEQQVAGAGPLDGGARRGALLHLLHAFTPDGTPLGTVQAAAWVREEAAQGAALSRAQRAAIPIEEKESYRWVISLRRAAEEARQAPTTQWVCVADSEADIYELLLEGQTPGTNLAWIVRACQNRALEPDDTSEISPSSLREQVLAAPVLFTQTIQVRGRTAKVNCETRGRRQPRESRAAEVAVRATEVTLRPPWRADRKLPALFEPAEWKAVWQIVRRESPPAQPPPLGMLVKMVAQLGGYVNRKRPDPPGPQTIWIGLQRAHDFALCWQQFGPEAHAKLV
jgi:hypothetical protein